MTEESRLSAWFAWASNRKEVPAWMYHLLLAALLLSFVLIPVAERLPGGVLLFRGIYAAITWGVLLMVSHRPVLLGLGVALAFPSPIVRALGIGGPTAVLLADVANVALVYFVITVLMNNLARHSVITLATVSGVTAGYLLLAVAWTVLYMMLETLQPCSFNGVDCVPNATPLEGPSSNAFGVLFYYSLVTISTLGYGDVTPASETARTAAALEAVVGQLFLVIVLARIVGLMVPRGGGSAET